MSHTPHELAEEFPDHADRIRELKRLTPHFARLADAYHAVNLAIHKAEANIEPTDDAHLAEMRKERLRLKDAIWQILSAVRA